MVQPAQPSSGANNDRSQPLPGLDDDAKEELHVKDLGPADLPRLSVVTSSGKAYGTGIGKEQQQEFARLCNLLRKGADQFTIDLTHALITRNGVTEALSEQDPDFRALRELVGKILKPKGDAFIWTRIYAHADLRGHVGAPLSFQWEPSRKLKPEILFEQKLDKDSPLADRLAKLKRHWSAEVLLEQARGRLSQLLNHLGEQAKGAKGPAHSDLTGRIRGIKDALTKLGAINPTALLIEEAYPLPPSPTIEAVEDKYKKALHLLGAKHDEAAVELALAGVESRGDYVAWCRGLKERGLKVEEKRDGIEHLIFRLVSRIEGGRSGRQVLQGGLFQTIFDGLRPEDADLLRAGFDEDCRKLTIALHSPSLTVKNEAFLAQPEAPELQPTEEDLQKLEVYKEKEFFEAVGTEIKHLFSQQS